MADSFASDDLLDRDGSGSYRLHVISVIIVLQVEAELRFEDRVG